MTIHGLLITSKFEYQIGSTLFESSQKDEYPDFINQIFHSRNHHYLKVSVNKYVFLFSYYSNYTNKYFINMNSRLVHFPP